MNDLVLKAKIDDGSTLYVSTIDRQTYKEHVDDDNLGGGDGYFVIRTRKGSTNRFELLAKAASFTAAGEIFDLIVRSSGRHRSEA